MSEFIKKIEHLSHKQLLLLASVLQDKLMNKSKDIAVIGMSHRLPKSPSARLLWNNLASGKELISFFDKQELIDAGIEDSLVNNEHYINAKPILRDIEKFDAKFFDLTPREARILDPQQRLFLECVWEAFEVAGNTPLNYAGKIGVYAGKTMSRYWTQHLNPSVKSNDFTSLYEQFISNDKDFLATFISYKLNLKGPSHSIQTACSTSLVAVDQACRSLREERCEIAIAGGVTLQMVQPFGYLYEEGAIMSPDGHCRPFDADASGTVFGDGVGVVVLKRLDDALADGDHIHAVIKGSATNNDGANKVGFTAPSVEGQAEVIAMAQAEADVHPESISYVEAHGTATPLGDPIEVQALTEAFGAKTNKKQFCALGSIKSNVGHLDSAAGITGLIKTVLALKHKQIPPTLHFKTPNPEIDFENSPFYVNTELLEWKSNGTPRRAGVSSFGIGGSNAHVILEEAPEVAREVAEVKRPCHLLTLSAKCEDALKELVHRYLDYSTENENVSLEDISFTGHVGRAHFDHRLSLVCDSHAQLQQRLTDYLDNDIVNGIQQGYSSEEVAATKIVFLCTGQGSQVAGMGKQLYVTSPLFKEIIDECEQYLEKELEHSLTSVLWGTQSELLNNTQYTQPALFALEMALAKCWQSWGIVPSTVLGHSVGEYVAACLAGVFSLQDGLKLIAARARLMQALPANGAMLAVQASEQKVAPLLEPYQHSVSFAAINGPRSVVLSGHNDSIEALTKQLAKQNLNTKRLAVSHAFHSPLMEPMLEDFRTVANGIDYNAPTLDLISNVTGQWARQEVATAEYWVKHIRQPVQFAKGIQQLIDPSYLYIEIGPQPILLSMAHQCVSNGEDQDRSWLPSLRANRGEWEQMLDSLGYLYTRKHEIDWNTFDQPYKPYKTTLPTYPFQRQRYWIEPASKHKEHKTVDYTYEITWRVKENNFSSDSSISDSKDVWLIFADNKGVSERLNQELNTQNIQCVVVKAGKEFIENDSQHFTINPIETSDYDQLLTTIKNNLGSNEKLQRIIYLWGLDSPSSAELSTDSLYKTHQHCYSSALFLMQAVINLKKEICNIKLWILTQCAIHANNTSLPISIAQSPLWGFGKVFALEHNDIWGGLLDFDQQISDDDITHIVHDFIYEQNEDKIAYRDNKRLVARLKQCDTKKESFKEFSLSSNSTYLITGGIGSLGLECANYLIANDVKHLVLIGRNQPKEKTRKAIKKIKQNGVNVLIYTIDISNYEAVKDTLNDIAASMPPLKGIIHAAGVSGEITPIHSLNSYDLIDVLQAKTIGTWNIHQLTKELQLDFLVCFSSIASVWGSSNQTYYAAANQFLDSFTHFRHALNLPCISINWGPWLIDSMSTKESRNLLSKIGVNSLSNNTSLHLLDKLLTTELKQVVVADIEWDKFKEFYNYRNLNSFFNDIHANTIIKSEETEKNYKLFNTLKNSSTNSYEVILIEFLQKAVANALGLLDFKEVPLDKAFFDLGLDSLRAIELKNHLQSSLQANLSKTLLFDYSTINDLSKYIIKYVLPDLLFSVKNKERTTDPSNESQSSSNKLKSNNEINDKIEKLIRDPIEREEFKKKKLNIRKINKKLNSIILSDNKLSDEKIKYQKTIREYDHSSIPFGSFSSLLNTLKHWRVKKNIKALYASAGGLYPVQIYLHVKPNRVDELDGGIYYYNPLKNNLECLSFEGVDADVHEPFINKPIFESSAFSIFFVAKLDAIEPMYGELTDRFCNIETGIISHLLTEKAYEHEIGLCHIGVINTKEINTLLRLDDNYKIIHTMVGGKRKANDIPRINKQPIVTSSNDIAVIGMSNRFPGASGAQQFWNKLCLGENLITFFEDSELINAGVDITVVNKKNYIKAKPIITDADKFDAQFFDLTPREATVLDPQSRVFLETVWDALEDSNCNPKNDECKISLFAGKVTSQYEVQNLSINNLYNNSVENNPYATPLEQLISNDKDYIATYVSYKLGLKGPSFTVQTACSTSLVATVEACKSLLDKSSNLAIAGGVTLHLPQVSGFIYQEGAIYSKDGLCKPYDSEASGTVFGCGSGAVVLKRLEDALEDKDKIYAVIKGGAINNDGADKIGFTAPSVHGQTEVITEALNNANLSADSISFVEGHGTATPIGDPIEVSALTKAFSAHTDKKQFCALGSVKSNIGHVDAAAGVAGLIKTALALKHKQIPPTLHFKKPNPEIDFENSPFYINTELQEWKSNGAPRRAGVSSFGIGGTNAHVILEEAPEVTREPPDVRRPYHLLTISAKCEDALKALVQRYLDYSKDHEDISLQDISYTGHVGRAHFDHRLSLVCDSHTQLQQRLADYLDNDIVNGIQQGHSKENTSTAKIAFLCTGQGSQVADMGKQLYESSPLFKEVIDECARYLENELETFFNVGALGNGN